MEEMRHKMEEANSRLERYEKLGMKTAQPQMTQSAYSPFRSGSSVLNDTPSLPSGSNSQINLEYLKNVSLVSYCQYFG